MRVCRPRPTLRAPPPRRRAPTPRRAATLGDADATAPSPADTARTIVDITAHGTLCTLGADGVPLGTYATYVLDADGQPLLRLRASAVHTANLAASPRCSLFVQPADAPARALARATLVGAASPVPPDVAADAAARHAALHGTDGRAGVDAPSGDDTYLRLAVESCFFVAGLGPHVGAAAVIDGDAYRAAVPDEMRGAAPGLVAEFNADRAAEVARLAAAAVGATLDAVVAAELLWVDATGAYARVDVAGGSGIVESRTARVAFPRPALDERDARSHLTMLCQLAWEAERQYVPSLPAPFGAAAAGAGGA